MLSFFAAASAPLRIRSQNESPGTSWVIIAIVIRGVSAVPPPMPPPLSAGFPPVLEQAPSRATTARPTAAVVIARGLRRAEAGGPSLMCFIAILYFSVCGRGVGVAERGDIPAAV